MLKGKNMGRRDCRDSLFKLIFQYLFNKDIVPNEALDTIAENMPIDEQKYVLDNFTAVINNYSELTEVIANATEGYEVKRIYKVDLAILLDAVYEIKFLNEPVAVIINEAVELAKKYSNEKSPSFINGVLSKIVNK